MKKKIMIIGAVIAVIAALALAYFYMTVWNARKSMAEAVEACNAAIREYNEGIEPYNEAAKKTASANEELEDLLKEAQTQIDSGKKAYDEDTLDELNQKVKKASRALVEVPAQIEPYELMETTDSFDKNILSEAEQKAKETESTVRSAVKEIPKAAAVPDYKKEISAVKKAQKAYADSVQQLTNVTAPGDDFVAERLGSIETVTGTAAVTKKNDPNRLLGEKGGYIGCVYFRDKRIELESLPEEVPSPETVSLVEKIWPSESKDEDSDDQSGEGETAETASTSEPAATGETASASATAEPATTGETVAAASTSEPAATGETASASATSEPAATGETASAATASTSEPTATGETASAATASTSEPAATGETASAAAPAETATTGETASASATAETATTGETASAAAPAEPATTGETAAAASTSEPATTGETAAAALPGDKKTEKDKKKEEKKALEIINAGTAGGGAVEVYSTEEEARERDQYLAFFEGSIMDPGGHAVEGTCVIRVSRHLEEAEQQELIKKIRKALLEVK